MSNELQALLKRARNITMTTEEREQQRRSFAYGNTHIENDRVTKATIDMAAQALAEEESE